MLISLLPLGEPICPRNFASLVPGVCPRGLKKNQGELGRNHVLQAQLGVVRDSGTTEFAGVTGENVAFGVTVGAYFYTSTSVQILTSKVKKNFPFLRERTGAASREQLPPEHDFQSNSDLTSS